MSVWDLFKPRGSDSTSGSMNDSDALAAEISRQHKYEQIKREGFDFDAEMERLAAEDAKDKKKR